MKSSIKLLKLAFPFLEAAPIKFVEDLKTHSIFMKFEKGQQLLKELDQCLYLPMVATGSIRVYRINESAKELTLYNIRANEICFLSANCIFTNERFPAAAQASQYSEVLMVPALVMNNTLFGKSMSLKLRQKD